YPLGHGDAGLLNEPVLVSIAEKYHKSTAQIILKWHVMEGRIPLPKSTNPVHQKENIDLFDFTLTDGEIKQIEALDCGRRYWHMTLAQQEEKFLNIHLD
ncbi:MAG: aldo/keto reductase, partial [Erysipelotrichaceae bacterium]|nr:aldo/keto reductase [Erysipelotrichaceae bacterium]